MSEKEQQQKMQTEIANKKAQLKAFTNQLQGLSRQKGEDEDNLATLIEKMEDVKQQIDEMDEDNGKEEENSEKLSTLVMQLGFELKQAEHSLKNKLQEDKRAKEAVERTNADIEARVNRQKEKAGEKNKIVEIINTIQRTIATAEADLKALQKAHPWLRAEEAKFTNPSDPSYVGDKTADELRAQLEHDRLRHQSLKKYDNPLCVQQHESIDNEYKDKCEKYNRLLTDRASIGKSIEILDKKKVETVESTFQLVNKFFSSIFSILLPGASSRLRPHRNNKNILVGCEMEVGFSGHWKDSLSELSGGQRSLLALSLILALLRCKPAPLYILDEVDAALDASHTQNIGKTIREHFQQSQFIIVSLKEGMFENANMLIRTQLGPNGSALNVTRRR